MATGHPHPSPHAVLLVLVLTSLLSFSVLCGSLFDFADRNNTTLPAASEARARRNLGALSQYNDPKAVVEKSEGIELTPDGTAPATEFVFLVAIEGSGHHFHESLFARSPAMKRLTKANARPYVHAMLKSLYNNQDKSHGLFSAPTAEDGPDGGNLVDTLARELRAVDQSIRKGRFPTSTMVPLNAGGIALGTTGMISYPNFHGRDRALQYPDLNALYYACDVAVVSCRHVVLTREPYAVIRSTTVNRQFSTTHLAIQMYTTMLDVILAQVLMHPDRLAACWEYDVGANEDLGALMGWDRTYSGMKSFRRTYASLFQRGAAMGESEKAEVVPPELEVYMLSMEMATERLRTTCREILQSQGNASSSS